MTEQKIHDDARLVVSILYANHRGETRRRRILPYCLAFGAASWHPEPQGCLSAWDLDKKERRTFALNDSHEWRRGERPRGNEHAPEELQKVACDHKGALEYWCKGCASERLHETARVLRQAAGLLQPSRQHRAAADEAKRLLRIETHE